MMWSRSPSASAAALLLRCRLTPQPTPPSKAARIRRCFQSGPVHVRPIGIGSAAPPTVLTNFDLAASIDTSDAWIQSRTGMIERRVLAPGECLRDLAVTAAKGALEMANVDPSELSLVICASSTPDDLLGDAPSIAHALGCNVDTLAYDIVAACSGFMFGTVTAGKILASSSGHSNSNKSNKKALVIGADALSRWVNWNDRNVCVLFGDGAGAVVLETSRIPGLLGCAARSNGAGYNDLTARYVARERPIATASAGDDVVVLQSGGHYAQVAMNGREVYKFATREVPDVLQRAMAASNLTRENVDWLLMHQANLRITEAVAERAGFSMDRVLANGPKFGNTSAASMPLALDEAVRSGQVRNGDVVACAGFGAGMSWGAAVLRWGKSGNDD